LAIKTFEAENSKSLLPYLIQAICDQDDHVRHSAQFAFEQSPSLSRNAVPRLIAILESGEPREQVSAALVLADLRPVAPPSVPALQQALENPAPSVKLAAAIALAKIEPENGELAPILFSGLTHPDRDLHCGAKRALWFDLNQDCQCLLPRVVDGLMDPSARQISAILLRRMGAAAAPAIPNLIVLLKTRSPGEDLDRHNVQQALASIGPLAIQPLLELLEHEEVFVRTGAMKTLGLMGRQACFVVPRLIDKLSRGCPSERIVAIQALGNIGPCAAAATVPVLRAVIQDRDLAVRCNAIDALGKMKEQAKSAIPDLCNAIKEASLSTIIKWRAISALKCIGPVAAPALTEALDIADAPLQAIAADHFTMEARS
jgi:HEAT repeat protein